VVRIDELRKCDRIYIVNSIRRWREAILDGELTVQS